MDNLSRMGNGNVMSESDLSGFIYTNPMYDLSYLLGLCELRARI